VVFLRATAQDASTSGRHFGFRLGLINERVLRALPALRVRVRQSLEKRREVTIAFGPQHEVRDLA
jgi:hypothetical protein